MKGCFYCTNDMFFKRDVKLLICEKLNSDASTEASGSIFASDANGQKATVMLTEFPSESMDECSYLSPSLDQ